MKECSPPSCVKLAKKFFTPSPVVSLCPKVTSSKSTRSAYLLRIFSGAPNSPIHSFAQARFMGHLLVQAYACNHANTRRRRNQGGRSFAEVSRRGVAAAARELRTAAAPP